MTADQTLIAPASRRARITASVLLGVLMGLVAYEGMRRPGSPGDFLYWHTAARALLDGESPYTVIPAVDPQRFHSPFYYPLPAAMLIVPIAWLPYAVSGAVFVGVSCGLLAYVLLANGWWSLLAFLSPNVLISARSGAWPPLIAAAAVLPIAGIALVAKPNLGVASFASRPSWWPVGAAAVLVALSFLVQPSWLGEWRESLRYLGRTHEYPLPVLATGAVLVPLALLRWRRPEARLLTALACVPQQPFLYDQTALWLVPRTRREFMLFLGLTQVLALVWLLVTKSPVVTLSVQYLTALAMVLRRPNEGDSWLFGLWERRPAAAA
jgi:hypothetical protein